eukprot:564093-Lingulodinium_polyedra.AAC.1
MRRPQGPEPPPSALPDALQYSPGAVRGPAASKAATLSGGAGFGRVPPGSARGAQQGAGGA